MHMWSHAMCWDFLGSRTGLPAVCYRYIGWYLISPRRLEEM